MNRKYLIPAAVLLLLAVFAGGAYLYQRMQVDKYRQFARDNPAVFVRDHSPTFGSQDAKVVLVEFFDPACGTCKAFYPFVKELMKAHPGKIRLVMRYTPFHKGSDHVVKLLEAAHRQGRFWEVLEATYAAQSIWASHTNPQPRRLWSRLRGSGLDINRARTEMEAPSIAEAIRLDVADARTLGVKQTPEFFVNGRPLPKFGYEQLQALVEDEVSASY